MLGSHEGPLTAGEGVCVPLSHTTATAIHPGIRPPPRALRAGLRVWPRWSCSPAATEEPLLGKGLCRREARLLPLDGVDSFVAVLKYGSSLDRSIDQLGDPIGSATAEEPLPIPQTTTTGSRPPCPGQLQPLLKSPCLTPPPPPGAGYPLGHHIVHERYETTGIKTSPGFVAFEYGEPCRDSIGQFYM